MRSPTLSTKKPLLSRSCWKIFCKRNIHTAEYWIIAIHVYFECFWVLKSKGIYPQILSNKITMFNRNYEDRSWGGDWECGDGCKIEESDVFYKLIKQHKELTLTTQDVDRFLRRWAKIMWEHGEEDLSEWIEWKASPLFLIQIGRAWNFLFLLFIGFLEALLASFFCP